MYSDIWIGQGRFQPIPWLLIFSSFGRYMILNTDSGFFYRRVVRVQEGIGFPLIILKMGNSSKLTM